MKVLFAVSNDNITTSVVNKYQQKYKEIITSKNVYYFNAIIKELQRDKSYDSIVIGEDLEPISNNNYESIDKFLFEKLDGISDEASKPTGEDIPIIFICSDRRTQSDQLLIKLFGIGIYNAIIGNDRSIDTVCNLIYKPRNKKEAKSYYRVEAEEVGLYEKENDQDVSESEIQNILAHYRKIGANVKKCVESFDSIADQYNETQLRVIINFLPNEVKSILETNSSRYQKLMKKGTVLSDGTYSQYQKQNPKVPGNLDFITKDLEKTTMTKPVIIPSTININKNQAQNMQPRQNPQYNINQTQMRQTPVVPQNNMQTVQNNAQNINQAIQGVNRESMQSLNNNNQFNTNMNSQEVVQKRGRGRPRKISATPVSMPTENLNQVPMSAPVNNVNQVPMSAPVNSVNQVPMSAPVNNVNQVPMSAPVNNVNQVPMSAPVNNVNQVPMSVPVNNTNQMQQPTNINSQNGLVPQMQDMHPLQQNANQEPKRGRGRPRKVVAPVQTQEQTTVAPQVVNPMSVSAPQPETVRTIPQVENPVSASAPQPETLPGLEELEPIQVPAFTPEPQSETSEQKKNAFDDVLPGLEENEDTVDLFSMDPLDDVMPSSESAVLPGFDNDIESTESNTQNNDENANLFDLDIEDTTTSNQDEQSGVNDIDSLLNGDLYNNDINSNPYSTNTNSNINNNLNNNIYNNSYNQYEQNLQTQNSNMNNQFQPNTQTQNSNINNQFQSNSQTQNNNMNNGYEQNLQTQNNNMNLYNQNPYGSNMNPYGENAYQNPYNTQNNINSLTNTNESQNVYQSNNVVASSGKITAFVGTTKNGTSFIVNNLAQLLSQNGVKTAILDLTKNKNSYYMFTDNDANLMKKATDSIKNLSNGIVDGLQVNKNLTVFTSLPEEIEDFNDDVILRTLSNNFEITLLDCDFSTQTQYFTSANEIYLIQSMDTFTIQPLTQFLSDLKLKNALDESKLRVVINKYVRLKRLDEKLIIGGMSKYNEPSMTLQRDLFNAQTVKYVTIPFEMDTYARYLESIAMCNLSLNGYSQNFLMGLENLKNMVYPLVSGGSVNSNPQNNTEEKRGLFGGKKNKQQPAQTTQFSNNVNDTLNKMRTNNF